MEKRGYWFDNILHRNSLLRHVIERKREEGIKVTERQRRGRKHLLGNLKEKRGYWFDNILHRNSLLRHVIERKREEGIKVTERQRRGRKHLLDNLREKRGYWKYEVEALDRTFRTGFGRGYGPVRQTEE
jgi:biotin operon repressor